MILRPAPQRSNYPFDPDNPLPKGVQLSPADLRAKYYKVIDPEAKFYSGDPRLHRDRREERDPKRTMLFQKLRSNSQEVFDKTRRYLIEEVARGRWYGKEHRDEILEMTAAPSTRSSNDSGNDMFAILSNQFGRSYVGRKLPPRKDFIQANKLLQTRKSESTKPPAHRSSSSASTHDHRKLERLIDEAFDKNAAPAVIEWLKKKANVVERDSLTRILESVDKKRSSKMSPHQQALAQAQTLRKLQRTQDSDVSNLKENRIPSLPSHGSGTHENQSAQNPEASFPVVSASPKHVVQTEVMEEPRDQGASTFSMPPKSGEIPPPERRKQGIYPFDWKPSRRVLELKTKLQEILSSKHRQLKNSFRRFDEDHRGTLDLSELYRVMVEESGIECTREELEELWDFFDRDRDGVVKYSDYAKTMGNDALDERDYFQIAQRKAAGRYNEAVKFYANVNEQDQAHVLNKNSDTAKFASENPELLKKYIKNVEEVHTGHNSLFTLPNKKLGYYPCEKPRRPGKTSVGTSLHSFRVEVAERLVSKHGSIESAFQEAVRGTGREGVSQYSFAVLLNELEMDADELLTFQLFDTFDLDYDGELSWEEFDNCFNNLDKTTRAWMTQESDSDILFYDVKQPSHNIDSSSALATIFRPRKDAARKGEGRRGAEDKRKEHMAPPRPLTALSGTGRFDAEHLTGVHARASSSLERLQETQIRESPSSPPRKLRQHVRSRSLSTSVSQPHQVTREKRMRPLSAMNEF
ncbi:hypothetical protein GUITHDRAFT_162477 [Guillardia theta CCMP2712]|uniref:EF-hand domain-containing protein n=1 Tax=Guillardia theta (strain CCMP2712) TaxID=905079 RepID=L1JJW3_GUITC|nr:hypothetical protein GUITHDRAFT_162477 [Guillardia theta CCMP2712]EKX48375.1 hypothetical protein GUITHDRAFT_162477 [Guillardia theta CCMP2712]|mmetsp:Transcript_23701/g.77155  ORF Transcript_23701/g.77155 Transcript_23701/m.77155 type:complete len:750 (+) Transcript_23701:329-2578(+)|eukprot:XP_005835355.1 hypothetical protein GUITHDRAFT_162477 [Guillardia theta CCMP2712]